MHFVIGGVLSICLYRYIVYAAVAQLIFSHISLGRGVNQGLAVIRESHGLA